jgi:hypothetical protein
MARFKQTLRKLKQDLLSSHFHAHYPCPSESQNEKFSNYRNRSKLNEVLRKNVHFVDKLDLAASNLISKFYLFGQQFAYFFDQQNYFFDQHD